MRNASTHHDRAAFDACAARALRPTELAPARRLRFAGRARAALVGRIALITLLAPWALLTPGGPAAAQGSAGKAAVAKPAAGSVAAAEMPQISGTTLDGKPFVLERLRGKVIVLFYWSTQCAVCRDKMPELRANVEGWKGKPFELVAISVDERRQDVLDYERIIEKVVPMSQRFASLWAGEPGYRDTQPRPAAGQLPVTLIIDRQGRVVERLMGRVPAEVWDKIAELVL
jgi:cytochrome oxidase Cu insertion factor (SCO1/SenC/PrrC family)